jgi:hypothetical protein
MAVNHPYLRRAMHMERDRLRKMISEYVGNLETELTEDNCLCDWVEADTSLGKKMVNSTRLGGTLSLECPVHTKEGLVLAFFDRHFNITDLTPANIVKSFKKAEHVE